MHIRLRHLWETISAGYWFVPMLMMVGATGLAFAMVYLDRVHVGIEGAGGWFYAGGADGAKTVLSTVAGSVITVAGVVFSITIAALTQASGQFGPRLLRNFMSDRGNQMVLGTFVATFVYCLLVLRTIHGSLEDGPAFVPHAAVTVAVVLATASTVVLIYFIHHVSVSLQAPSVVAAVLADLRRAIARMNVEQNGSSVPLAEANSPDRPSQDAFVIHSDQEGYVQAIDYRSLVEFAEQHDLVLHLNYRPGDYLIRRSSLLLAWPKERCDSACIDKLNSAFICGSHSTPEQDIEHAVRQLVEVAVRALSPGINDPFTAIDCLNALGAAVCQIAQQGLPGPHRNDRAGRRRLVLPVTTMTGLIETAFNQIRQHGANSVAVTIRLLEVITICAEQMPNDEQRKALAAQAAAIYRQSQAAHFDPTDHEDIRRRWEGACRILGGS